MSVGGCAAPTNQLLALLSAGPEALGLFLERLKIEKELAIRVFLSWNAIQPRKIIWPK
jgi:hypothetical protein